MNIKITLDADDYLTYHLYRASKSPTLKKRRLIHWFSVPLAYIVTGIAFVYLNGAEIVRLIFFVTAGVWIFVYPFYSKWAIRRFLIRQVNDKFADILGKEGSLKIMEKKIVAKSHDASLDIPYTEIKDIIELPQHILVGLNSGPSLILPRQKVPEDALSAAIKEISRNSGIAVTDETLWVWR